MYNHKQVLINTNKGKNIIKKLFYLYKQKSQKNYSQEPYLKI